MPDTYLCPPVITHAAEMSGISVADLTSPCQWSIKHTVKKTVYCIATHVWCHCLCVFVCEHRKQSSASVSQLAYFHTDLI